MFIAVTFDEPLAIALLRVGLLAIVCNEIQPLNLRVSL